MLHLDGMESIVVERQSKAHVFERIRAGVLEDGTVQLLRAVASAHVRSLGKIERLTR